MGMCLLKIEFFPWVLVFLMTDVKKNPDVLYIAKKMVKLAPD